MRSTVCGDDCGGALRRDRVRLSRCAVAGVSGGKQLGQCRHRRRDLLPTSAKVRDRFGNGWAGFGFSIGNSRCPSCPKLGLDFDIISRASGSNFVYLVPVGLSYVYPFPATATVVPYAGIGADLVFSDIRSVPDNVHAAVRLGTEIGVIAGIAFYRNWQLQARYNFLSPLAGFDFSGLSLSASMTL